MRELLIGLVVMSCFFLGILSSEMDVVQTKDGVVRLLFFDDYRCSPVENKE